MLEVVVPPEEFLRQMFECDAWMPESEIGEIPAMYIRKEGTRIRIVVDAYTHMETAYRISWQQRLDLLRTAPEITAKRRY